jgi:hypothetical protein
VSCKIHNTVYDIAAKKEMISGFVLPGIYRLLFGFFFYVNLSVPDYPDRTFAPHDLLGRRANHATVVRVEREPTAFS